MCLAGGYRVSALCSATDQTVETFSCLPLALHCIFTKRVSRFIIHCQQYPLGLPRSLFSLPLPSPCLVLLARLSGGAARHHLILDIRQHSLWNTALPPTRLEIPQPHRHLLLTRNIASTYGDNEGRKQRYHIRRRIPERIPTCARRRY